MPIFLNTSESKNKYLTMLSLWAILREAFRLRGKLLFCAMNIKKGKEGIEKKRKEKNGRKEKKGRERAHEKEGTRKTEETIEERN